MNRRTAADLLMYALYILIGATAIAVAIDPVPSVGDLSPVDGTWVDEVLRIVALSMSLGSALGLASRLSGLRASEAVALSSLALGCLGRCAIDLDLYGASYLAGWWLAGALGLAVLALDAPRRQSPETLLLHFLRDGARKDAP